MKTVIDNSQRVFLVHLGGTSKYIFCNLEHIPDVLVKEFAGNSGYSIHLAWNKQYRRVSAQYLNELFVKNNIDFKIK